MLCSPRAGAKRLEAWWACCIAREKDVAENSRPKRVRPYSSSATRARSLSRCALFMEHNGKRLQDCYRVERVLGKGGMGTVRLAHLKQCDGIRRAIKEVRKRSMMVNLEVRREASILQNLDHPCICRIFETFEDSAHIYFVMEYIEGQELFEHILQTLQSKVLDEPKYVAIMKKVFGALHYLHEHEVLHRDVKPENIMVCHPFQDLHDPNIKLIDFGLAVLTQPSRPYSAPRFQGTRAYLAPEAVNDWRFSPASDMWSTGVIIFVLYVGHLPRSRWIQSEVLQVASTNAQNLLQSLLQHDPWARLTAADAMRHPWIQESTHAVCDDKRQQDDIQKAMQSFVEFHQTNKLHKAALTAVAAQITGEQIDALREQFCLADTDGNGLITKDELIEAFKVAPPDHVQDVHSFIGTIFEDLDSDGSGAIDFTEWEAATLTSFTEISDAALQAAFRTIDVDSTGCISLENLGRLIQVSHTELECIVAHADRNNDGVIDFEEFKAVFAKVARRMTPTSASDSTHMDSLFPRLESDVFTDSSSSVDAWL